VIAGDGTKSVDLQAIFFEHPEQQAADLYPAVRDFAISLIDREIDFMEYRQ